MINSVKGGSVHIGAKKNNNAQQLSRKETKTFWSHACVCSESLFTDEMIGIGMEKRKKKRAEVKKKTDPNIYLPFGIRFWTKIKEKSKCFIRRNARLCRSNFESFFYALGKYTNSSLIWRSLQNGIAIVQRMNGTKFTPILFVLLSLFFEDTRMH